MIEIRSVSSSQKDILDKIVTIHIYAFPGFFLSSMHRGFLRQLYKSFIEHDSSDLKVAFDGDEPVGFIAYSWDTSGVFGYMLRKHFVSFVWYSFLSFLRRPKILLKLLGALNMPGSTKRDEHYCKIFSIGVAPDRQGQGIGRALLEQLKHNVDYTKYSYITLETDAKDNDAANAFYKSNGMTLSSVYITPEGRVMNKYHYRVRYENRNP